jgi:teichuronic acid biosynthesis glycosyltransferase TuaH
VTDLVVLSLEPWDAVWRRNQHLVAGLLRSDSSLRVLFVEPAADPLHAALSRGVPRWGRGLRPTEPQVGIRPGSLWLFQPTKLLPRKLGPGVDARLAGGVVRQARRLGFSAPLLWVNDPAGAAVLEATGWPALYDVTDDWLEADRTPAEHARLLRDEAVLMDRCAEVVVCSPQLATTKGVQRPVTIIQNAVDVEACLRPHPRPQDIPDGPVAVYVGTVHTDRIDVDLCVATAEGLSGRGRLVMVGPAALESRHRGRLERASVVFTGPKPRDEVPAYLQHADVLVVPHVVTPFTESLDPIKVYEYRAVGRRVVSTPVAGFREAPTPQTTIAEGADFVSAVAAAVPARAAFPDGAHRDVPSWAQRVREMSVVLERVARPAPASPADSP